MRSIPVVVQQTLPHLMDILKKQGYITDPQVLVGGVGDFFSDDGPFQIGQFESDNRVDEHLGNLWLEGNGGGGNSCESYQLALYFFAKKTVLDCFEKRKRKGYLFIIGDEMTYEKLSKAEASKVFGDGIQADIPVEDLIKEVKEKYYLYFVIPGGAYHSTETQIRDQWARLIGDQSVIMLDDPSSVCEAITMKIGTNEGKVTIDEARDHLKKSGAPAKAVNAAAAALTKGGGSSKVARL